MAKAKELTYKELMDYALEHYNKGGDATYECWDERTFNEYVAQFGGITKSKALKMFKSDYEYAKEMMATAW